MSRFSATDRSERPARERRSRWVAVALLGLAILLPHVAAAADGVTYGVSYHAAGPEAAGVDPDAAPGFVASLDARPGVQASLLGRSGQWQRVPQGAAGKTWLSLVVVAFGEHRDWLALQLNADGAVALAARRPAHVPQIGIRRDGYLPGQNQISINAVKELAADFDHLRLLPPQDLPLIAIRIENWSGDGGDDLFHGIGGLMDDASTKIETAGAEQRLALLPLASAAAFEAGFRVAGSDAPVTVKLEIGRLPNGFALRAVAGEATGARRYAFRHVPTDRLYDHLAVLFRMVLHWGTQVGRIVHFPDESVYPLAGSDDLLTLVTGDRLLGWDVARRQMRFRLEPPPRQSASYVAGPDGRVLQLVSDVRQVDVATGRPTATSIAQPASPRQIDITAGDAVATAAGETLVFHLTGQKQWESKLPWKIEHGPAVLNGLVLVAGGGAVAAVDVASGNVKWTAELGGRVIARPHGAGALVLVVTDDLQLTALQLSDGRQAWRTGGDVLVHPPVAVASGLLVADKTNTVRIINPADGSTVRQAAFKHWLSAAVPAGDSMACIDRRGVVTWLRQADLAVAGTVDLGRRVAASAIRTSAKLWDAEAAEGDEVVAVADDRGFIYVLPVPQ